MFQINSRLEHRRMEENYLFSVLKVSLKFSYHHEPLKVANSQFYKLQENIAAQKQTINESTILSIQNLEAWHEGARETVGLQLNWQERWKKL